MTKFEEALENTLAFEGGFNDVKGDKGGATKYGISLNFLKSEKIDIDGDKDTDADDIRLLDRVKVTKLYKEHF